MKVAKQQVWIENKAVEKEHAAQGVDRKVLAYCNELMCVENYFETGAVGKIHNHPHTQITYVVSGEFEFTIGNETRLVVAGDCLLKEDGVKHGCLCVKQGVLLDIFTPMREDFVEGFNGETI